MVRYWWRVFTRAFRDAGKALEHNPNKVAFVTIAFLISLGIITRLKDGPEVFGRFESWLYDLLVAGLAFGLALFFFVLRTPKVLEEGAGIELDKLEYQAHVYIKENFPQDTRFVAECPITFHYSHEKHVDLDEARTRCQKRIDGLKSILKHFG
jgi:hypothetical protein